MKKILIISSLLIILIAISTIGYQLVSASVQIDELQDIISIQENKEKYITPYGYTIDNPNIILNPYGISPLSAIILFETVEELPVTITIKGHNNNTTFTNTFKKNKKHYLPIYGLYPNEENNIEINCNNTIKNLIIKTESFPEDLVKEENASTYPNQLTFISNNKYTYALDNDKEIRWYLNIPITQKLKYLEENSFLVSTNNLNNLNTSNTLLELDLLGKIHKQYIIDQSNNFDYLTTPNYLYILNKNLLEIEKQTLTIKKTINLEDTYNEAFYSPNNNTISLLNQEQTLEINLNNNAKTTTPPQTSIDTTFNTNPYTDDKEYQITKGIKIDLTTKTRESNKNIILIGYKDTNKKYNQYNINIIKTTDTLKVIGEFNKEDEVYLVLDKFLDKKVYNIKDNQITINKKGLSGQYSIYLKINKTIYKTNNYITF